MTGAWPTSLPHSLDYPHAGADALLAGAARAYGDHPALRDGEESLGFTELHDHALRIAAGLRAHGIGPGDVVALHMPNSLWYVVTYYGALCAGAAVAAVNPAQPARALRKQLLDCAAKAVITHPAAASVLHEVDLDAPRLTVVVPPTAASPARGDRALPHGMVPLSELLAHSPLRDDPVDPGLVAHLQLTGGTTGESKAVRVLHRNVVTNVLQAGCWRACALPAVDETGGVTIRPVPEAASRYALVPGEGATLAVAPFFHGLGLIGQNVNTLLGTTTVITGRFDPDSFLADVERYGVTVIAGSPSMYYALLRSPALSRNDLSSVTLVASGAAPIDTVALTQLREVFPHARVCEGYGLTEATMGLAGAPLRSEIETPLGSVGVPLFDTEIEIRSPLDGRTVLPQGETGEIWARGPQITDGYQGHPELTAVQYRGGWLRTGDMGRLDEHGHLFLVGRAKDMIIYKGYNVYPQPLEEILCSHSAVAQAAVVGAPSETAGEVPVAFVVLRPGVVPTDGLADELMAHVADQVAPYQKVRAVHIVEALPVTPTGKILKSALRQRLT
ncbi:class I adenylate-forming enzyme family protein [Streptomyces venezuelae]|uniref:class I adenylate-forming enzyme family protein n=1 Tax=Streptomyces venezuelae TaxID=54571 RepID=UPI003625FAAA